MLKTRFFSALVFVPLTLLMIFIGGIPYYIYIAIILGVATWEYWRLFKTMGFHGWDYCNFLAPHHFRDQVC
jgi:phosphatidate cytidylyltransferase